MKTTEVGRILGYKDPCDHTRESYNKRFMSNNICTLCVECALIAGYVDRHGRDVMSLTVGECRKLPIDWVLKEGANKEVENEDKEHN
ncbi:MAG: hypothetical protein A2W23_07590 [Planctomycetes bacterium RBG_16_43_13]|nr:MAG: hypothetical protein A2W23_07590 [Planctomycetes bacterium RBG_16_43_13]